MSRGPGRSSCRLFVVAHDVNFSLFGLRYDSMPLHWRAHGRGRGDCGGAEKRGSRDIRLDDDEALDQHLAGRTRRSLRHASLAQHTMAAWQTHRAALVRKEWQASLLARSSDAAVPTRLFCAHGCKLSRQSRLELRQHAQRNSRERQVRRPGSETGRRCGRDLKLLKSTRVWQR